MADPRYQQHFACHMKLAKGGYCYVYNITRNGEHIGTKTIRAETRSGPEQRTFAFGDDQFFTTAKEFIAAYEASLQEMAS